MLEFELVSNDREVTDEAQVKKLNSQQVMRVSGGICCEDRICDDPGLTPEQRSNCLKINFTAAGILGGLLAGGALMEYASGIVTKQAGIKSMAMLTGFIGGALGGGWLSYNLADSLFE